MRIGTFCGVSAPAQVELPHSVFTSLPDYDRFLSTLEGELVLEIDGSGRRTLQPLEVCQFDGGLRVESWGKCRDFNLMLRKGRCTGEMTALHLVGGERRLCQWDADVAGLYCCTGSLGWLQAGQFALADRPAPQELAAQAETIAVGRADPLSGGRFGQKEIGSGFHHSLII